MVLSIMTSYKNLECDLPLVGGPQVRPVPIGTRIEADIHPGPCGCIEHILLKRSNALISSFPESCSPQVWVNRGVAHSFHIKTTTKMLDPHEWENPCMHWLRISLYIF